MLLIGDWNSHLWIINGLSVRHGTLKESVSLVEREPVIKTISINLVRN